MSFCLTIDSRATVDVVVFKDSALEMTREEYDDYLKDPDNKSLLRFADGKSLDDCTVFSLRKVLPFGATQKVLESQVRSDIRGNATMNIGFILDEVRAALINIKSPDKSGLEFKRGSDGQCSEELIASLYHAGVLMDLYIARLNSVNSRDKVEPQKK